MYILLLPYVVLVGIYFIGCNVYIGSAHERTWKSAVWKCLPVIYLMILVFLSERVHAGHQWYKTLILLALVSSTFGDISMHYRQLMFGIVFFTMAHIFYIFAFGWTPVRADVAFWVVMASIPYFAFLIPTIPDFRIRLAVVSYVTIIGIMGWRATALYLSSHHYETVYAFVGAWAFIASDTLIAVTRWMWPFEKAELCIMITYYAAQMFIVLSGLIPAWRSSLKFRFVGL